MRIKFSEDFKEYPANIKIVGIGGGGGNAINRMIQSGIKGVELIAINTDAQALRRSLAPVRIQIGERLTKGLGVGGDPVKGRQAAEESRDRIEGELVGADMVFITVGMGGGTGTGAAPIVAEISRQKVKALTVGVVTFPFDLEGRVRAQQAELGIKGLRPVVDTLLVIPNDRLFDIGSESMLYEEGLRLADEVLGQAVRAITDVITVTGVVNVDFADVRAIMTGAGEALMGIGESEGADRALQAVQNAIKSPLLEKVTIEGAKGVLINITSGEDFKMKEVGEILNIIRDIVSHDAHIYYGQVISSDLGNRIKITVIATGFPSKSKSLYSDKKRKGKTGLAKKEISSDENIVRPAYLRYKCKKLR